MFAVAGPVSELPENVTFRSRVTVVVKEFPLASVPCAVTVVVTNAVQVEVLIVPLNAWPPSVQLRLPEESTWI